MLGMLSGLLRSSRSIRARKSRSSFNSNASIAVCVQSLESRPLLSAVSWTGGAGTSNWSDGQNWSGGAVPGPGDDVSISNAMVTIVSGAVRSLSLSNGTLQGGSVTLESGLTLSSGGKLKGVALSGAAYTLTSYGGVLDGASISGNANLASVNGSLHLFRVLNGLTLNGTARLSGGGTFNGPSYAGFVFEGNQTLDGGGTIIFANNFNNTVAVGAGSALTIGSGITIRTNGASTFGTVGFEYDFVSGGTDNTSTSFVNYGTISADGGSLMIRGNGSLNNGNLGAINGGQLKFEGSITNNTTIAAGPNSQLDVNGVVIGGAITAADGATISVSAGMAYYGGKLKGVALSGGTYALRSFGAGLDAVSISGNVNMASVNGSRYFHVQNGLTLNGVATLSGSASPSNGPYYAGFVFEGNQTLGGAATIVFANNVNNAVAAGVGSALTIGSGITIRSNGVSTLGYVGFVHNFMSGGTDDTTTSIINYGTILADGGSILIRGNGSVNNGNLGAVNAGELKLQGAMTNTSTISVGPNSELDVNGVVIGGAITAADNAIISVSAGVAYYGGKLKGVALSGGNYALRSYNAGLDAVSISGNANLASVNGSSLFRVQNGLTLNGTATLSGGSTAFSGFVFEGTQSVVGNGVVVFSGTSIRNMLAVTENSTLTLGTGSSSPENSITVRGHSGTIGYLSTFSGPSNTTISVINYGNIIADTGAITVNGGVNTNYGNLQARNTASLTFLGSSVTNGDRSLSSDVGARLIVGGDVVGDTTQESSFVNRGELQFNGGNIAQPRLIEAMSEDFGAYGLASGINFTYDIIRLGSSTRVRVIDNSRNNPDSNGLPEVLYVRQLIVPAGSVLDLNGKRVYALSATISGSVVGGTLLSAVANQPPTDITLNGQSVTENVPSATLVGTFSTTDPDGNGPFTYSLVAGSSEIDTSSFQIVGNQLLTTVPLDFEVGATRTIRVQSRDSGGLTVVRQFVIAVTDVDEGLPRIVDNGDAGFTTTGNWTSWSQDGHGSDLQWSHSSTGPATATWSFTGLTPGQYRVSSTWLAASNRATNAPYTIRSAAGGSVLGSALVNQQLAPGDFSAQGAAWDDLGIVTITGTTLVVELTNVGADQYIIADAIRIEPIPVTAPFVQIIDNGDAGYLATGAWTSWGQDGHGSDLQWSHSSTGLATATWSFTGLTPGEYRVSSTWLAASNRATNASYSMKSATGMPLGSALINQQHTPNDFSDQGSAWEDLGIVTITGTTLVVELTNVGADQYIIADAIRIERGPFSPPAVQVVDNGDAGYSTTGAWTSWGQDGHGSDLQWSHNSTGPATATWSFTSLIPGKYRVSTTWLAASNRATNASYFFRSAIGGSALGSAIINQQSAPNDFSDQGSAWEDLGIVTVTGSSLVVELTNAGADHYIIADAIRIERIGD